MTVRDFFGGVSSVLLMLGSIGLCLLFALYDRVVKGDGGTRVTGDERASARIALSGR